MTILLTEEERGRKLRNIRDTLNTAIKSLRDAKSLRESLINRQIPSTDITAIMQDTLGTTASGIQGIVEQVELNLADVSWTYSDQYVPHDELFHSWYISTLTTLGGAEANTKLYATFETISTGTTALIEASIALDEYISAGDLVELTNASNTISNSVGLTGIMSSHKISFNSSSRGYFVPTSGDTGARLIFRQDV